MKLWIFKRRLGWYWRFTARNGRVLAVGGEPFSRERDALRAFKALRHQMARFAFYGIVPLPLPRKRGRR